MRVSPRKILVCKFGVTLYPQLTYEAEKVKGQPNRLRVKVNEIVSVLCPRRNLKTVKETPKSYTFRVRTLVEDIVVIQAHNKQAAFDKLHEGYHSDNPKIVGEPEEEIIHVQDLKG